MEEPIERAQQRGLPSAIGSDKRCHVSDGQDDIAEATEVGHANLADPHGERLCDAEVGILAAEVLPDELALRRS